MKPEIIYLSNNESIVAKEGLKLKVFKDCFDQRYLHELTSHYREGLEEKKLQKDSVVTLKKVWSNFYGKVLTCIFNGNEYDLSPSDLIYERNA